MDRNCAGWSASLVGVGGVGGDGFGDGGFALSLVKRRSLTVNTRTFFSFVVMKRPRLSVVQKSDSGTFPWRGES